MSSKERRVSQKYVKRQFSAVGLFLILYALFVLIVPYSFNTYMQLTDSPIVKDHFLYFGIYLIIILFGTLIPFYLMRRYFRVTHRHMNRNISATFLELYVQAIVCFSLCILLTYVSNILFSHVGMEGRLICSIGLSFNEAELRDPLYVFLLLIVTPIIEEYAFRGVLINTLGRYGKYFAMIASAVIFAVAHVHFSEFIPAFAMGILLGKISLRYKSIRPTIIIHILFNALLYVLCIVPSSIARYMSYFLAVVFILTVYLVLSGRYERISVQRSRSERITNLLFYTRPTVILAIALMITYTVLFTILS